MFSICTTLLAVTGICQSMSFIEQWVDVLINNDGNIASAAVFIVCCRQSVAETGDATSVEKEEEKVMTLDEWKAQEDAKRAKADFKIRKAGEGCNGDPQWTKMVALTKKEKTEDADEEEELVRN